MLKRSCVRCGAEFEAQTSRRKYCSATCRARASDGTPASSPVAQFGAPQQTDSAVGSDQSLLSEVRNELERAGRLDTALGQQALVLAEACYPGAPQLANVSKELRDVRAAALEGVQVESDPLDELKERRDSKRDAG